MTASRVGIRDSQTDRDRNPLKETKRKRKIDRLSETERERH